MKIIIFIFLVLVVIIPSSTVFALEGIPNDVGISTIDVIKVIVYLVLILLLIYYLFWLIKKRNKYSRSSIFNSFGGFPLGQNKSVQVIEIGNKIYILGVGENINLIQVLENENDTKAIKSFIDSENMKQRNMFGMKLNNKKVNNYKQFENELTEKFDQIKEKRIYSINNIFEEKEITEKRD